MNQSTQVKVCQPEGGHQRAQLYISAAVFKCCVSWLTSGGRPCAGSDSFLGCSLLPFSHGWPFYHLLYRAAFKKLHSLKWKLLESLVSCFRGCEQGRAMDCGFLDVSGTLSHRIRRKGKDRVWEVPHYLRRGQWQRGRKKEDVY